MELFVFKIQSISDVITNSSSELFVFDGNDKKEVIDILDSIYPNWRDEYDEPQKVADFDREKIYNFLINTNIIEIYYFWNKKEFYDGYKNEILKCCYLARELGLSMTEAFDNWETWDPTDRNLNWEAIQLKISDKFVEKFKEKAEKEKIYALYSLDENPLWEYQELLSEVAERHHLG